MLEANQSIADTQDSAIVIQWVATNNSDNGFSSKSCMEQGAEQYLLSLFLNPNRT